MGQDARVRPFRFLAAAPFGSPDARELAEAARRAEAAGFSTLVLPDHLLGQHAPVPLLTAAAAATERLRVGTFVLNVDLRHPAVLAQELASLDVLSGGRLEIGIGAGWNRPEYDAIGVPFEPVPVRVARLAEAVPQVAELDVNPLMAVSAGAFAVDVKVRILPAEPESDPYVRRLR